MIDRCPVCGYELAGLPHGRTALCPECGSPVDSASVREEHWESVVHGFKWVGFALSPALAVLPTLYVGIVMGEHGERALAFLVSWFAVAFVFAFSALRRRWRRREVKGATLHAVITAGLAALAYTSVGAALAYFG